MKIVLPDGYELPENARPGEPFEVVALITPGEDGSYSMTAIDGIELDKEEPAQEEKSPIKLPWEQP